LLDVFAEVGQPEGKKICHKSPSIVSARPKPLKKRFLVPDL
jgi:hypothetical protein